MKKYLFGLGAIALAIGFSAFTVAKAPQAQLQFQYSPSSVSEAQYETVASWLANPVDLTPCPGAQTITCKVKVLDTQIAPFPGATQREKFVAFLQAQASATNYINANIVSRKP